MPEISMAGRQARSTQRQTGKKKPKKNTSVGSSRLRILSEPESDTKLIINASENCCLSDAARTFCKFSNKTEKQGVQERIKGGI